MSDIIFEVTPPRQSMFAGRTVTQFIRDPTMLEHLRHKSGLNLNEAAQATLECIPIRGDNNLDPFYDAATEPVNEHGKLTVKVPRTERFDIGNIMKTLNEQQNAMTKLQKNLQEVNEKANAATAVANAANARSADTEKRLEDTEKRLEESEESRKKSDRSRFVLLRANLLTALVKKLCADTNKSTPDSTSQGVNNAGHKITRWVQLAESFKEAEVKKATQDFKISRRSRSVVRALAKYSKLVSKRNQVAHESSSEMAKLLMSSDYHKTNYYYLWGGLFEYVYGQTIESTVEHSDLEAEDLEVENEDEDLGAEIEDEDPI